MPTVKDVAKAAGVSPITVSRVVNTPESVSPKTRGRVEQAMADLHYVPNAAAKNLVTNRSGVVDVYVPESIDLSNPFVMHLIAGISKVLSDHMYSFLILRSRKREHRCDGYIVTGLLKDEIKDFERYARERERPVVLFGHTELSGVDCIDVDNVAGAKMGVEHLIALGHRDIAMINVDEDKDYPSDRLDGYRRALLEHGLDCDEGKVIYVSNSVDGGAQAIRQLLGQGGATAAFCATDTIGIGAASELIRTGYSVPEDFSLVGFDGLGHQLLVNPTLTSVQQPIYDMGKMLAQTLLDRLDGHAEPLKRLVEPVLVHGQSTASPHARSQEYIGSK